MDLYLLYYKNYYDRQAKVIYGEELQDYLRDIISNVNFNPGDGIETTHIVNTYLNCNYAVLVNPTPEGPEIESRWYVTEALKTRNGQYRLTLKRDVIADNYSDIIDAPMYIEKAKLQDSDPMIFNNEGMTFNRIKKQEIELKDDTGCGWIVGYTQLPAEGTQLPAASINFDGTTDYETALSFEDWRLKDNVLVIDSTLRPGASKLKKLITLEAGPTQQVQRPNEPKFTTYVNVKTGAVTSALKGDGYNYFESDYSYPDTKLTHVKACVKSASFISGMESLLGYSFENEFDSLNEKIVYFADVQKYYKILLALDENTTTEESDFSGHFSAPALDLFQAAKSDLGNAKGIDNSKSIRYKSTYQGAYLWLVETQNLTGDLNVVSNWNSHLKLAQDADYAMFCIPCPKYNESVTFKSFTYSYQKSMAIAQLLTRELGTGTAGRVIDLQLLPYCPIDGGDFRDVDYVNINNASGVTVGRAYTLIRSSFKRYIYYSYTPTNLKIESQCDTWRLISPNYASSYEFSMAKNRGVSSFHVNCTYKPFTPFIDIHPSFNIEGLYGQDFDDNRGLILAGDFSLPMTSEAWRSYQIQNKNYSNIFDRQMQNLDLNNKWGMAESVTGAIAGTAAGAAAGAMVGGVPGAIIGGAAAAIGGTADVIKTGMMQGENRQLQKDMYSYQLGNVDNKPNSLVKSSAFDINYKMYPILEYISCTDVEKQALIDKLKYNGMTVCRIGKISDFLDGEEQYIQGLLIRLNLNDDSHMVNTIAEQLAKGIYIE